MCQRADDFSTAYEELLEGRYDCVDRIVLNGYFPLGQQGGGFRTWWRQWMGSEAALDPEHWLRLAGRFRRRVHAHAEKHHIPIIHCAAGERKHKMAEPYLATNPDFQGVFLILVARAPGLVWEVKLGRNGVPHLQRKTPWPYVNHYHFHIMDSEWGHSVIKMSGHPPFGLQVMLNGHEWVERQARRQTISALKEGNCFVGGSNFQALDLIADTLCDDRTIGRLAKVCDRWVYSACLCFALDLDEQARSGFAYQSSCYQLEYSRNLLFVRGAMLDQLYQSLIDRTRRTLDVEKLKTIFGWKHRPHNRPRSGRPRARIERVLDESAYDLTVFKVHFGKITLKIYDKGDRVLRIEAIVHNTQDLRCGRRLEKLSIMLAKLQRMVIDVLNVVQAVHVSYLDDGVLDALPQPTEIGARRLAGVDIQKPRMRAVMEGVLALAAQPGGFTAEDLAKKVGATRGPTPDPYTPRQAAYDLRKLRGKDLVERISASRRYRVKTPGIAKMGALFILREKVLKPLVASAGKLRRGPKSHHPLDAHYENLQRELRATFETLAIAI